MIIQKYSRNTIRVIEMKNNDWMNSDKYFWHQYIETYRKHFSELGTVTDILEYGIFHGDSIRWLREEFPEAKIVGIDILTPLPDWPTDQNIAYIQADQGNRQWVREVVEGLNRQFDLIIEDGSHVPQHQAICLTESFKHVRSGGIYILEDIHTSHPRNHSYKEACLGHAQPPATCLTVLLAIQHMKAIGMQMTDRDARAMETSGFFSAEQILEIFKDVESIDLYKRTVLPLRCYKCGGSDYNYRTLKCACGVDIYEDSDSMSFIIKKK